MAFFECTIGGGNNAVITVAYDSSFYNKTMTCSNGIDTYTQTTTSSGVTEFEVDTEGTWAITCNGVSQTVEVVFNYTLTMAVTKTITVHSAANDTLYFVDAMGSKTVTTDSSGQGSVTISVVLGDSITFTSSVAKNPDALALDYSKAVVINANTTDVYIMPEHTLYWYGYNPSGLTGYPYDTNLSVKTPTITNNTNSIRATIQGNFVKGVLASTNYYSMADVSNIKTIVTSATCIGSGQYGNDVVLGTTTELKVGFAFTDSRQIIATQPAQTITISTPTLATVPNTYSGNAQIAIQIGCFNTAANHIEISALWYE